MISKSVKFPEILSWKIYFQLLRRRLRRWTTDVRNKVFLLLFLKSLLGSEPNIYNFIHYIESECQLNAFEYKLTAIIFIQFKI